MNKNAKMSNKTLITIVVIIASLVLVGVVTGKNSPLLGPSTQCSDRIDNDGDGRCDYGTGGKRCLDGSIKGDPGCSSRSDNTETSCVIGSTTCGVGACQRSSTCVNDQVSCTPGSPLLETCNGVDDDCDGTVDEDLSQQCGVSDVGQCEFGTQTCSSGIWGSCVGNADPVNETCDGADNDCDGVTDEGCQCTGNQTQTCGTDVGECVLGSQTCSAGQWGGCVGEIGPTTEACDGLDNDCDALIDDGVLNACGTCGPVPTEVCDGVDNDCDGTTDEGCQCTDGQTQICGTDVGACQSGTQTCSAGQWGGCVGEIGPTTEACGDSIDNDCDGTTDEGCANQCSDGIDNDGDTYVDYPADSKCTSSSDNDESPRDFCNDSDAGIKEKIQGTVSGEDNSTAFSNTDFCVTATTVREYYCNGLYQDYNFRSTDISCAGNTTTICSNGACI